MIFVTGANGLVGSFIVRQLLEKGESIRALKRKTSDLSLIQAFEQQIEWIEGDLLDYELLNKALKDVDYVIHTAAIVSFDPNDFQDLYITNVEGTANLVNACLANSIKKICHLSSIAAIGKNNKEAIISEETKWENSEHNSHYAKSKYLAELEIWRGIEEGLNAVIVNPTIILGPGDWEKSSAKLFKQVWKHSSFYPTGFFHYVDVRDVSTICIKLLYSTIQSERFILDRGTISYFDFFNKVATQFGVKLPSIKIPYFLISFLWRFEKIRSLISSHKPLVTKETSKALVAQFQYENKKIHKFIEHQFHSVDDSIQWTCQELIKKNSLSNL